VFKDIAIAAGRLEPGTYAPEWASSVAFTSSVDEVYREHAAFVWRVLRGMGLSPTTVDDALQDVFIVVHRRLGEFDGRHAIKTWLFEIAYRVASDHRRKQRRTQMHEPLHEALEDHATGPGETAERQQALRIFAELLDGLSEEQRVVLVLAELEGMTAPEISTLTGVTLNTVYTRLRRARIAVNEALVARGGKAT
jgi:RNA polymerase sigma-70 factor (ECF subfamily)